MNIYLGLDTSNYTTSLALADNNKIIANIKQPLSVKYGEKGLRQSEAVFSHIVNLPILMERIGMYQLSAIGYSAYPRDVENSYMPCFLAGEAIARSIAAVQNIPCHKFSHQAGHIMAAIYSSGKLELLAHDFIAFHVSGGTTEILYVTPNMQIQKLGGTLDLNAGQAIDRIGTMLGLQFPCGVELEKLALNCTTIPCTPNICVKGNDCNLSGLENKAIEMKNKGISNNEIALYTFNFLKLTIEKMTQNAIKSHMHVPVLYAGGVMSNTIICDYLKDKFESYFAKPEYSSDNASGIALLCKQKEE